MCSLVRPSLSLSSHYYTIKPDLARLQWRCASQHAEMEVVEQRLRDAMQWGEELGDVETRRDAMELLARLLCQGKACVSEWELGRKALKVSVCT